jgi:hypothetical protein
MSSAAGNFITTGWPRRDHERMRVAERRHVAELHMSLLRDFRIRKFVTSD